MAASIDFFFDPVCPWAWRTSCFVRAVAERTGLAITWRFFSLRMLNEHEDYAQFPDGYQERHELGLALLRLAAHVREHRGHEAVASFYRACGTELHELGRSRELAALGDATPVLFRAGLTDVPSSAALLRYDGLIRSETELAVSRSGPDLGTPVITIDPPIGPSFFGPVMSELPEEHLMEATWASLEQLARLPGFSELKRTRPPSG